MPTKLTKQHYYDLASERNLEWLSDDVPHNGVRGKTRWRCRKCGHDFSMQYSAMQAGQNCPKCGRARIAAASRRKAVSADLYFKVARERQFTILDPIPSNANEKFRLCCSEGHEFVSTYSMMVNNGCGCQHCSGSMPKTLADYLLLAEEKQLELLDQCIPSNTSTPTHWKCLVCETESLTSYYTVSTRKACPGCSGRRRKTREDYERLAAEHGYTFADDDIPRSVLIKTKWICSNGHLRYTTYHGIRYEQGCPACREFVNGKLASVPQRKLCDMLQGQLNYSFGRKRIDVAVFRNGMKIAVEYDCAYWHINIQDRDQRGNERLTDAGWHVLRIKSGNLLPEPQPLEDAIQRLIEGSMYEEIVLPDWIEYMRKWGDLK